MWIFLRCEHQYLRDDKADRGRGPVRSIDVADKVWRLRHVVPGAHYSCL
jgi:hypothetical protein